MEDELKIEEKSFKKNWPRYFFILFGTLFVYFLCLRAPIDPDMGWHLMDGKYLIEHNFKAAKTDIFSHSMSDFPLIMHEWTHDIMMYKLFIWFNFFGLAMIYAAVTCAAFILVSWGIKAKEEYKIIPAILGAIAGGYVIGVKAQMFSLLGLASIVFIIFKFRQNPKTKLSYLLPLIFLLWVNFHGGFAVGLFFIGVFLSLEYFKKFCHYILGKTKRLGGVRKWLGENSSSYGSLLRLDTIFIFSCLATLINPYGWRIYIEIVTTIFDSYAKSIIGEWLPVSTAIPLAFQLFAYLALLGILLIMSWRKADYTYLAIVIVFLYLAFSSWRHVPIFIIISIPLWVSIVEHLSGKELSKLIQKKWFLAVFLLATVAIGYQRMQITPRSYSIERMSREGNFPIGAVRYLHENTKPGNLWNEYNWGGYLIWQYPERKVYIDGRMASWKLRDRRIFLEFNKAMEHKPGWEKTLEENNITQALVYNNPSNDIAFTNLGWSKAYGDYLSLVFDKPDNQ
jgi:hypothetical protein